MNYQDQIQRSIITALKKCGISDPVVELEHPADLQHGDLSCNAAMKHAKELQRQPLELAQELAGLISQSLPEPVERVEPVSPGFINFYFQRQFFSQTLRHIIDHSKQFGRNRSLTGQKVMLEHSQPNPFKEFHVGHLVNNIIGEALVRITAAQGVEVKPVSYHGDVGLHVAKAIWAIRKHNLPYETVEDLGRAYAQGDAVYKDDEQARQEIKDCNRAVYDRSNSDIDQIWEKGRAISLEHFHKIYNLLGSRFDKQFFESQTAPIGREVVGSHIGSVFEESEGAVVFPESRSGLHTRVFITSEGLPTYEAKDLGLLKLKQDHYSFDLSITVVDVEQQEYFKVVNKAAEIIWPELQGKLLNLPHGRLRLTTGRLSSRKGNIISGDEVLGELQRLAREKIEAGDRVSSDRDQVAKQIAVAAIKYAVLRQSLGRSIVFDPDQSLSFEGDSGPYLQYTYTRAISVLRQARTLDLTPDISQLPPEIRELERWLYRFPEMVEQAYKELAPHQLISFLTKTASLFNSFYAQEKIADQTDSAAAYKLALTQATAVVMERGLEFLGIEAPAEM